MIYTNIRVILQKKKLTPLNEPYIINFSRYLRIFKNYESQTCQNDATTTPIRGKAKKIVTPSTYFQKFRFKVGHKITFFWVLAQFLPYKCTKSRYIMKCIINSCYWVVFRGNLSFHFFSRILDPPNGHKGKIANTSNV